MTDPARQENVARFQIAMHHAVLVRLVQRVGDLDGDAERLAGLQRTAHAGRTGLARLRGRRASCGAPSPPSNDEIPR